MCFSYRNGRVGSWVPTLLFAIVFAVELLFLASPAQGEDAAKAKPLATEKLDHDVVVEVTDVYRGSDGLLQVNWVYRNPTGERVHFMSGDEGRDMPEQIYLVDAAQKKKYPVANVKPDKGKPTHDDMLVTHSRGVDIEPNGMAIMWAKFLAPAESTKQVSLYLPNAPPIEDLPIQTHETAQAAAASEGAPLAKAPHESGAQIEVTRVHRSSDGTVEIRWRYVNTGNDKLEVMDGDHGRDLVGETYVMDPDAKMKYPVASDDRKKPLAGKLSSVQLEAGKSADVWMKFPLPTTTKRVSLFVPGALPIEDLPISEGK
jgi:hypothetical protein